MAVSSFRKIRDKIRESIRDKYGLLWDDTALDEIINEAQREYSLYSGSLAGTTDITATNDGICACPVDFIEAIKFIGTDGIEKGLYSWRYLSDLYPDFRRVTGTELRGIVTDFDGYGKFRLFPKLPEGTEAGKLYYKRFPKRDEIETLNEEAIEQHCLYQVFLLTGKAGAVLYYNRFLSCVNEEGMNFRGLKNSSRIRGGRFY